MPITYRYRRANGRAHAFDTATAPEDAHFGANDIGWQALAPALACSILASIIVAARWYSRCCLARCVGMDDYVILLSLVRQRHPTSRHTHNFRVSSQDVADLLLS